MDFFKEYAYKPPINLVVQLISNKLNVTEDFQELHSQYENIKKRIGRLGKKLKNADISFYKENCPEVH